MAVKIASDDRGAIAVEFCVLAPIFIALIVGVTEFGMIFYTYYAAVGVARNVTRQLATNSIQPSSAEAAVRANLPPWVRNEAAIKVSQTKPGDYTANDISVSITISGSAATPIRLMSWAYGSINIKPTVTMQQEPVL